MATGAPIDQVYVELQADLEQFEKALASGDAEAKAFAQRVASNFANVEGAMKRMGVSAKPATDAATGGVRNLGGAMQNLSYQLNDIVSGLAMGQSPFTIMTQQGGQVAQILGQTGVKGALVGVKDIVVGLLTPARLATGGLLAIGTTAAFATMSWQSAQHDIEAALMGIGKASGATLSGINDIASRGAGAGLSVGNARDIAVELVKTGKVASANLELITAQSRNLSLVLGTDMAETGKILAKVFSDPLAGADQLNNMLGFLDSKTRVYIQDLVQQGNRTKAQQVLVEASKDSISKAAELTGFWAREWDNVARGASVAYNWVGKVIDRGLGGGTLEEKIADRTKALEDLNKRPTNIFTPDNSFERAQLETEIALYKQKGVAARNAAEDAAAAARSLDWDRVINSQTHELDQIRSIRNEIVGLNSALKDDAFRAHAGNVERATRALQVLQAQEAAFRTPYQQIIDLQAIETRQITAYSPAQQARLETERKLIELGQSRLTTEERNTIATNAGNQVAKRGYEEISEAQRQRVLSGQQQIQGINQETQSLGLMVGEVERVRYEHGLLAELEAEAARKRIAVSPQSVDAVKRLAAAYGEAQQAAAMAKLAEDTFFERAQLARSDADQAIYSKLKGAGLLQNGEITNAQVEYYANQLRINDALKQTADLSKDALKGVIADMRAGKSAGEIFANVLDKIATKAAGMAVDAGVNAILKSFIGGTSGFSLSGITGGLAPIHHDGWGPGDQIIYNHHTGVGPNEHLAKIRNDEGVFTPGQMQALGGSTGKVEVNSGPVTLVVQGNADASTIVAMKRMLEDYDKSSVARTAKAISEIQRRTVGR